MDKKEIFEIFENKDFDKSSFKNSQIIIKENSVVELNLKPTEEEICVDLEVEKYASFKLVILNEKSLKNFKITANLHSNSEFYIYFADFSLNNLDVETTINLVGDYALSKVEFASLVKNEDKKKFVVNFEHIGKNTSSDFKGFGVVQNKGNLVARGDSHITKPSVKSSASQLIKVILFDKESKSTGYPILRIDCDDIKANHGCAIGTVNPDHIFYLLSRGLNLNEARKLITAGYLLPIAENFKENEKKTIEEIVERSI